MALTKVRFLKHDFPVHGKFSGTILLATASGIWRSAFLGDSKVSGFFEVTFWVLQQSPRKNRPSGLFPHCLVCSNFKRIRKLEKAVAVQNSLLKKFSGKFRLCWKIAHQFSGSTKCYPCQGLGIFPARKMAAAKISLAFGNAPGFSLLRPPQPPWVFSERRAGSTTRENHFF